MDAATWIEISLALATIIGFVAFYHLIIVRPLSRKLRELMLLDDLVDQLRQGTEALAGQLSSAKDRQAIELRELAEGLAQLERRGSGYYYEQAINLAEHGGRAERLVSYFGLPEAEANLISLLHGERADQASLSRDATRTR